MEESAEEAGERDAVDVVEGDAGCLVGGLGVRGAREEWTSAAVSSLTRVCGAEEWGGLAGEGVGEVEGVVEVEGGGVSLGLAANAALLPPVWERVKSSRV